MNNEQRMTNDERRTMNDERRIQDNETRRHGASSSRCLPVSLSPCLLASAVALLAIALLLTACAATPGQTPAEAPAGGGSFSAETVAQSFFDDLDSALKDPKLSDDEQRGAWVERLAGYFAPNERDDQRIALRAALDSFATGQGKLDPNTEKLTLELKIDRLEQVEQNGDHAMIRPVNGAIHVLITRSTGAGLQNLYEETVPLEKIIGNNGSVPVVRIGRSWFLTEG